MTNRKEYFKKYWQKHKNKMQEQAKQYRLEHPEYYKHYSKTDKGMLKIRSNTWKYKGIILLAQFSTYEEQYEYFYNKANGQCQICHKPLSFLNTENMETAHLDHSHSIGKPRGILCRKCNILVGMIEITVNGDTKNVSDYISSWKK